MTTVVEDFQCDGCNEVVHGTQVTNFISLAPTLIIHLKRSVLVELMICSRTVKLWAFGIHASLVIISLRLILKIQHNIINITPHKVRNLFYRGKVRECQVQVLHFQNYSYFGRTVGRTGNNNSSQNLLEALLMTSCTGLTPLKNPFYENWKKCQVFSPLRCLRG